MDIQLIYIATIFISFAVSILTLRKQPAYFAWLSFLLLITCIEEGFGYYMLHKGVKHSFISHFYSPVEFLILSYMYYREVSKDWMKKIIVVAMPVFLLFSAVNIFYLQKLNVYNSYGFIIKGVFIVLWVLLFFYDLYMRDSFENPLKMPMFWISIGLIFFFSGTILVNGYIERLMKTDMELAKKLYKINTFLNIFLYLCIAYGLTWKKNSRI
jgi:hypothetical protein